MSVQNEIYQVLEKCGLDDIEFSGDQNLRKELHIDSTELVEISISLEKHFKIKMSYNELLPLETINDLVQFVENKIQTVKGDQVYAEN